MVKPLWKTAWRLLETLTIEITYDPVIPLLSLGPEKIILQNDTCTLIFRTSLFTIAKTQNPLKCPLTER